MSLKGTLHLDNSEMAVELKAVSGADEYVVLGLGTFDKVQIGETSVILDTPKIDVTAFMTLEQIYELGDRLLAFYAQQKRKQEV